MLTRETKSTFSQALGVARPGIEPRPIVYNASILSLCKTIVEQTYCTFLVNYVGERPWWPIQSLTEEESEKLREERDQIKFTDFRFER